MGPFSTWSQITSAIVSLAIAYTVETSQALDLVDRLGLIAAYTLGILATLTAEASYWVSLPRQPLQR